MRLKSYGGYLINTNTSIALAESCTGGLLSAMLVSYPGISSVYLCGTVAYSNQAKIQQAGRQGRDYKYIRRGQSGVRARYG